MRIKILGLFLALNVASWAQTTTPAAPASPHESAAPQAKADAAHCAKMAGGKDEKSCCHHEISTKDGKAMSCGHGEEASSCCKSEDSESCMKAGKDKTAACAEGCGKDGEKGCCASSAKDDKAMNCCTGKQHCAAHSPAGE